MISKEAEYMNGKIKEKLDSENVFRPTVKDFLGDFMEEENVDDVVKEAIDTLNCENLCEAKILFKTYNPELHKIWDVNCKGRFYIEWEGVKTYLDLKYVPEELKEQWALIMFEEFKKQNISE